LPPPSLSCSSWAIWKKDKGKEEALQIQEGFLQESFYPGAPLAVSKDSAVCSDPTEAIAMAKIACIIK
jgi:hypothetical protein